MGMFDTVFVPCPSCGHIHEFQSKAGECQLRKYRHNSVPAHVAASLAGETTNCRSCGVTFVLKAPAIPRVILQAVVRAPGQGLEDTEEYD